MTDPYSLGCACGAVHGAARGLSPSAACRVLCYCLDCQAFGRYLGRPEILDEHGGTEVVPVPPAALTFDRGQEHLQCLRLSPKGLFRWYAACCRSPIGNTPGLSMPFIGLIAARFDLGSDGDRATKLGPLRGFAHGGSAIGGVPADVARLGQLRMILRTVGSIARWKLTGQSTPHPFFDATTRQPIREPQVLTLAERKALTA